MNNRPIKSRDLVSDIQTGIEEAKRPHNDNPTLVVRIGGRDYVATNVKTGYDGVIGHHIVVETESLAKFL